MSQVAHQAGAYPGFCSMKRLGAILLPPPPPPPLDGMLVHRRATTNIKFPGTHLYTWLERDTVRVKCLAQEHNTNVPGQASNRTPRSGDEDTNHEATAPHKAFLYVSGSLEKLDFKYSGISISATLHFSYLPITPTKILFFSLSSTL